jgi:uncharacterized protein involved in exopolysaccharide biosynthesis
MSTQPNGFRHSDEHERVPPIPASAPHITWDGKMAGLHEPRQHPVDLFHPHELLVPAQQASHYLRAIRRRWWIVAVVAVLATVGAFAYSAASPKKYDATADVVFGKSNLLSTVFQSSGGQSLDPERDVNTNLQLVTSYPIAQRVLDRLRLPMTMSQLLAEVNVSTLGNSNVLAITARDPLPSRAASIANAFAGQYIEYDGETTRAQYGRGAQTLKRQLDSMTPANRSSEPGRALADRVQQMEIAAAVSSSSVRLLNPATRPTSAAVPRPKTNVAIALIVGLFLGSLLAIGLARRDWD